MPDNNMEALNAVMSGREERASEQSRLISGGTDYFVCQISLNIPGFPKRLDGDMALAEQCIRKLIKIICCEPLEEVKLINGAGAALLILFDGGYGAARRAKAAGIFIEENTAYGRIVDIDVITARGPLSRKHFSLGPRRCLICGGDSKECAREQRHSYEELRAKTRAMLGGFIIEGG